MTCPDENTLLAYVEGALDTATRAAIDQHLAGCSACHQLVAEVARLEAHQTRPHGLSTSPSAGSTASGDKSTHATTVAPAASSAAASSDASAARPELLAAGTRIDHFQIRRPLASGGMSDVYMARDTQLGRKIALKLLRHDRTQAAGAVTELLAEARATAKFSHPNIVTIYAAGLHGERLYLALEYVEGQTLRDRMREKRPGVRESMRIAQAIARALAEAHRHQVLHRDLKPANVMIGRDGRIRVVDFGLAALAPSRRRGADSTAVPLNVLDTARDLVTARVSLAAIPPDEAHPTLTYPSPAGRKVHGAVRAGTPAYMAPEQWRGEPLTDRADIWALGLILHELLAGHLPFSGIPTRELGARIIEDDALPPLPLSPEIPPALGALVAWCLHKVPGERPEATEVVAELSQLLSRVDHARLEELGPFRGLSPFDTHHSPLFFGRQTEVAVFLERLRETPALAVVGPSGVGKSSFIRAGVIPRLKEQGGWRVLELRPGRRPFQLLADRLVAARGDPSAPDELTAGPVPLAERLAASPELLNPLLVELAERDGGRVLLFVDQLEEIFTQGATAEVTTCFVQALAAAADELNDPVRLVFTLREDFLGQLAAAGADPGHPLLRTTSALGGLTPGALREVLNRPVESVGYRYDDPDLVSEMVASVEGERVGLPLLQFAGQALWERRDREHRLLRRVDYQAMGGVAGALARHADGILQGMGPEEIQIARSLVLRLVTPERTRRELSRSELLEGLGGRAVGVLDRMVEGRLLALRSADETGERVPVLELVHESLIETWDKLRRWIDQSREEVVFWSEAREAALLWARRGRRADEVWQGEALAKAGARAARSETLPDVVRAFLEAGQARANQQRRRRRTGITLLVSIAVVSASLAVGLALLNRRVERQRRQTSLQRAEALREGAQAALLRGDPMEARAKVRSSLEIEDDIGARALWWQLERNPLVWTRNLPIFAHDLAYSPRGDLVALGGADSAIYLIAPSTLKTRVLRGDHEQVYSVAFHPSGRWLVSGSAKIVTIWSLGGQDRPRILQGHDGDIYSLSMSADGRWLASSSSDPTLRVWDWKTGRVERILRGHEGRVPCVAFSPDGRWLASGGMDGTIRLWEWRSTRPPRRLAGHGGFVQQVSFSPDGRVLASASADQTARLWDWAAGRPLHILRGHTDRVRRAVFSPDGQRLVTSSRDRTIRLWESSSGRLLRTLEAHKVSADAIAFAPDGVHLVSTGGDSRVHLWDLRVQAERADLSSHSASIVALQFSPDGKEILSGGWDKTIISWDTMSGEVKRRRQRRDVVHALALSPDGQHITFNDIGDLIRLEQRGATDKGRWMAGHSGKINELRFGHGGEVLLSAGVDATVRVWDSRSGAAHRTLSGHTVSVSGVDISPSGELAASVGFDGTLRLWRLRDGATLRVLKGIEPGTQVRFAPDGDRLVFGGEGSRVRLWNRRTDQIQEVGAHGARVYSVAFDPAGQRVASCSADHTGRIWPLTGGPPRFLRGNRSECNRITFSPDGSLVATAGDDQTVRLFRAADGRPLWRGFLLGDPLHWISHRGCVTLPGEKPCSDPAPRWRTAVAERSRLASASPTNRGRSPDGAPTLCLATWDNQLEIWDLAQDRRLLQRPVTDLQDLLAVPGGCLLLAGGEATHLERSGSARRLSQHATAIGCTAGELLVATAQAILRFRAESSAHLAARHRIGSGATALARSADALLVGYREGQVEVVPLDAASPAGHPLMDPPASPVSRIVPGPRHTVVAGYADGTVVVWDLRNGRTLQRVKLHGAALHLERSGDTLYLGSALGTLRHIDLRVLEESYCTLLQRIWRAVPFTWRNGRPLPTPPPPGHACTPR